MGAVLKPVDGPRVSVDYQADLVDGLWKQIFFPQTPLICAQANNNSIHSGFLVVWPQSEAIQGFNTAYEEDNSCNYNFSFSNSCDSTLTIFLIKVLGFASTGFVT